MEKTYRIFWIDGTDTLIYGNDIASAFTKAGFGAGAVKAIDYYKEVENKKEKN